MIRQFDLETGPQNLAHQVSQQTALTGQLDALIPSPRNQQLGPLRIAASSRTGTGR